MSSRRNASSTRDVRTKRGAGAGTKGSTRGAQSRATSKRTAAAQASSTRGAAPQVGPMYKRLPHGPHRLARKEVVLNQRARIHGAMIEAIARSGYEETSVKQVIALAGVSRRSFYEQFANKQACFLATFDLIVRRDVQQIRRAFLEADGSLETRARAGFERFAQMTTEDRNAAILVVLEAQRVRAEGVEHLRCATGAAEQMLAQSYAQSPDTVALPTPIVRAIVGGLHGIASAFLRAPADAQLDVAEEMLRWTLLFQAPSAEHLSERMAPRLSARIREISSARGHGLGVAEASSHDERTRTMLALLRLATREDYRTISPPQIMDEANVSIDAFCELFGGKSECFLAALDMIGDELLSIVADPVLVSDDWPTAVRTVLDRLMRHLGEHPLQTRTLAQEAFFAGAEALERVGDLARGIATLLTEGAPVAARGALTVDAIAGAIWHTLRCQVVADRIPLLAALSDHLAYIVLAPYVGAEATVELLTASDGCATDAP
jgi:AcrR family transcriptional regulator